MRIILDSLQNIQNTFVELGYTDNPYYDYPKEKTNLNYQEIKKMHLLSDTDDFKIWAFELDELKVEYMNKIANKLYRMNSFEYNLLVFISPDHDQITFLHYHREEKGKIKIRRLNLDPYNITATDKEIIQEVSIKGKNIIDDLDIADVHKKAFDIEKVTKRFFLEFKAQIDNIQKNIKGLNKKEAKKSYAVLLASRMIFLYFIQKKGWLNGKSDYLYDRFIYCEKEGLVYYEEILEPLFFECLNKPMDKGFLEERSEKSKKLYQNFISQTDKECNPKYKGIPYLNGGLFERHPKYEVENKISIDNKVFESLFENLLNKYNFTVREDLGYDADIAVDPELLGRIFENMINSEERKETGSFYTPRPIINYMCKQSIKEYLRDNSKVVDYEKIDYLVTNVEEENLYSKDRPIIINEKTREREVVDGSKYRLSKEETGEIINLLEKVQICDPAVGSGAFILGMLQLLLLLNKKLYYYGPNRKNIDLYETKKEIIKNNLYGVDIQEGATEIAHLRLWLSLAVEYEADAIENINPLPNLNYKIIQGNSLITEFEGVDFDEEITKIKNIHQISMFKNIYQDQFARIISAKKKYFSATINKKEIEAEIFKAEFKLIKSILKLKDKFESDSQVEKILLQNKDRYFSWALNFEEIFVDKDEKNRGFDIVIGNPPYVSTRDVNKLSYKTSLEAAYGFKDDLYNHFTFKGIDLLKENGILAYITSNTFLTLQTKLNMRELLQEKRLKVLIDTPKAFEALVDTSIFIAKNKNYKSNYDFEYIDATKGKIEDFYNLNYGSDVVIYNIKINTYRNNLMKVFFKPNKINMQIYKKHIPSMKKSYKTWWDKIKTSREIRKNEEELKIYRESLNVGDITLLGLITEGGQGLATGDNGRFLGVIEGTNLADDVKVSRALKFYEVFIKNDNNKRKFIDLRPDLEYLNTKEKAIEYIQNLKEEDVRGLFDELKENFGRHVFGRGYIYRIVRHAEIIDVNSVTQHERENGIKGKISFIPYNKGDKEGHKWYFSTPFYIDWSLENVEKLKRSQYSRWQGYDYFFKEGFSWNLINGTRSTNNLKFKLIPSTINDVGGMKLNYMNEQILKKGNKYILGICNSTFMNIFTENFINFTLNFQLNDARKLPITMPNKKQLNYMNDLVDEATEVKKKQFSKQISETEAKELLSEIQEKVDEFVYELYNIQID